MPLIKTNFELPRGNDPVKQAQRLAQDISKNFQEVNKYLDSQESFQNPVGTVVNSMLTEQQFQQIASDRWVLADGRNCTGSLYFSITGNTTVPTIAAVAPIVSVFIRIN